VTAAGAARCWGNNWDGQLGDGTTTRRPLPVPVRGLRRGVVAIAAGYSHSCALTTAGAVWCWGLNSSGQLGDGTTAGRTTPARVRRLPGSAAALSAGALHSCAVTAAGAARCWGENGAGQLGDGSTGDRLLPVAVRGLRGVTGGIAAGGLHGCAVSTAGAARCWGANSEGQLGDGTTAGRPTAAAVRPLPGMTAAVAAGEMHSCARSAAGVVHCWGNNWEGQIGDGSTGNRLTPVEVTGLPGGVAAIGLGARHSCAATSAGQLWCWGKNISGQLGDGTRLGRSAPVRVVGIGP
jgi:alpha-tubulin suppressor-like RCC1 family protein